MPRDYKHQKRQDTNVPRSGMGFVAGLTLGLTVALGVFIYDRRVQQPATAARMPEQRQSTPRPATPTPKPPATKVKPSRDARLDPQFDFYEMLPKFEVVIPEQDESAPAQSRVAALQKAGVYVLQAGSFRNSADAERVRAMIALQGVQSKIQRVSIDRDTWHRVRIGPITDLRKLEDTRDKLRQVQIEALVIRVGG
jgi:cell division protein FtsN